MDKNQNQANKCYCAHCFMPINADDMVDIEGQNYHRICSLCCICRQVPTSLKTFYGHVFCQDCFKRQVLKKNRGQSPRLQCQRCRMQWAPEPAPATHQPSDNNEAKKDESSASKKNESKKEETKDKSSRKCFCSRCLQRIEGEKVEIDGQCFHKHCAKCCRCRRVPTTSPKIYNGRVFCSECYRTLMSMNRKADSTAGFCREWKNPAMAHINQCMAGNTAGFFMMMQHGGPFCGGGPGGGALGEAPSGATGAAPGGASAASRAPARASAGARGWPTTEPDKYDLRSPSGLNTALPTSRGPGGNEEGLPPASPAAAGDFALDTRTGAADVDPDMHYSPIDGSAIDVTVEQNKKIEKLTKLLRQTNDSQYSKKWKNFDIEDFQDPTSYGWVDIQDRIMNKSQVKMQQRPQSLWQCGVLKYYYVTNDGCDDKPSLSKDVMCNFIRSVWK